jgi:hypothetical protein
MLFGNAEDAPPERARLRLGVTAIFGGSIIANTLSRLPGILL